MRWFSVVCLCLALTAVLAAPDPKKYKNASNEKDKKSEALTNDEKKFLREVEEKFGVKSDVPVDTKKEENKTKVEESKDTSSQQKAPFPAVIAIEIVNDTDSKSKGKRTIDANLGYGYRTNQGYTYTYFGKSNQEKGKFMIYPYSQEDIPPSPNTFENKYNSQSKGKYSSSSTDVEIQPSQAYELVPLKNEQTSYEYKKPAIEFKTDYEKALESSSGGYSGGKASQTLYTTYNGQEFSGLSGQFPTVMPNYFVNPTQLLSNPHYQNAGLTQDHLRTQSSYLNQNKGIVPVLVLRVPSSYLKNPTAELYPDLPNNYPLSQHLNGINLQALVNQYFQKHGFSSAPQIMSYQSQSVSSPQTRPQHYSNPYVKPSYTQSDYSGIQYSGVKPVMARYPMTHTQQKYLVSQPQSLYQHPVSPQVEYEYRYVPQTEVKMRSYYIQPQYQQSGAISNKYQYDQSSVQQQHNAGDTLSNIEYSSPQYSSSQQTKEEYGNQNIQQEIAQPEVSHYTSANSDSVDYSKQTESSQYDSASLPEYYSSNHASASLSSSSSLPEYYSSNQGSSSSSSSSSLPEYYSSNQGSSSSSSSSSLPEYYSSNQASSSSSSSSSLPEYYSSNQASSSSSSSSSDYYSSNPGQSSSVSVVPSKLIHTEQYQETEGPNEQQQYVYQSQNSEDLGKSYVLSENYPSKDHTIATVLPISYKSTAKPSQASVQTVSYVTPMPSAKYQSQYRVMVPQTVLRNPNSEKVSYVNSQPMHYLQAAQYSDSNSDNDYTVSNQYIPPVAGKSSYPRNYHAHPKRMVKTPSKSEGSSVKTTARKSNERSEKKKSS